jgi:hypothetical protein
VLSPSNVERYGRDGFLVVPTVLSEEEIAGLRSATDELVERSRSVAGHNEIYDLEPDHNVAQPRVRRIKTPDKWDARFAAIVRHPGIIACLKALWGPDIRFDSAKLNMKAAGFGAAVEWHQDWAFYPNQRHLPQSADDHDMAGGNGLLMVMPGSTPSRHDHHAAASAMDPTMIDLDLSRAVPCIAGWPISISPRPRDPRLGAKPVRCPRRIPASVPAADAWPPVTLPRPGKRGPP